MSLAAKQKLLREIRRGLGETLTWSEMNACEGVIYNCISRYDIEEPPSDAPDITSEECLREFVMAKRLEGRTESTVKRYEYVVRKLLANANVPIRDISVFHIRQYLTREKARGISPRTLDGYRSIYQSFFRWCRDEHMIAEDPCGNLAPIKCQKKVREPYSDVDFIRLCDQCVTVRDRAILYFLMSTGCRVSEVCSLNRDSVDLVKKECVVLGKGMKERTVFVNDITAMLLSEYLASRKDNSPALFINRRGGRLTDEGVRYIIHKVAEKAGVENAHPHRFRRTLATNLINRGMPIQEVASILGHDKLDTTMQYVYMDKTNTHNSYRKYA